METETGKCVVPLQARGRRLLRNALRDAFNIPAAVFLLLSAIDALDTLRGRRGRMRPPKLLAALWGGSEFEHGGEWLLKSLIELADLRPDDRVLDVGCGIGRNAVPLTRYLSKTGSYEGFDIIRLAIEWNRRRISRSHPNFRFHFADIHNEQYTPGGKHRAYEYRFPYEDASFDVVFLASVFTHMVSADTEHYLSEIARVLRPGGRYLATFFIINSESLSLQQAGRSRFRFIQQPEGHYLEYPYEAGIAHEEGWVRDAHTRSGLHFNGPIFYGNWCGREKFFHYQDIVVSTKAKASSRSKRRPS
ncbi:MAG: methyltransferase domain-containing protein [Dehalococcoidia bacterium]